VCFISSQVILVVTPEFMPVAVPNLSLLAVNLTRRCNLACAHCYLDAKTLRQGDEDELSTSEVQALLDDVAALGHGTMVVLTGGEPLVRKDLDWASAWTHWIQTVMTVFGARKVRGQKPWRASSAAAAMGSIFNYIFP